MSYKPFDLSGKVALISGGNGGIGLGMAEAIAASGGGVMIWGTNAGKNTAAVTKLKAYGVPVASAEVDVSDEKAVIDAMASAVKEMGRIDSCIANAGINVGAKSFLDISGEKLRKVMSVNLDGALFTLREAARHMIDRAEKGDPGGSLVGVASLAGLEGAGRNEHYGATKGGVLAMMRGIAVELARYGIRANSVAPGWIATDMTQGAQDSPVFTEKVIARVPIRRWGRPEDFGGIAVYLTSDASAYHSGDTFVIDGGYAVF
ncbi:MAG: SDR family oxidoreductase [Alphaproteobacteria bacterium]|nr:SDR family oxidoreductase [Alphaproteobacteria bacterium]